MLILFPLLFLMRSITLVLAVLSYISQRKFTFKVKEEVVEEEAIVD